VHSLPVTPLHYPIAKIVNKIDKTASLSLPALIVGTMVPDLEVPFLYHLSGIWQQDRMVLHSLIGGLTLGTLIAVAITVFLYNPIVSTIFPINKQRLKHQCHMSGCLVFSAAIGVLSHNLLDVANHAYNPVFWPFLSLYESPSPLVPLLGGAVTASLITHGVMLLLFIPLFIDARRDLWNRLLVG
jgi:membrane-bound metal-dependent hydrolase YbcI (DUF457 family)